MMFGRLCIFFLVGRSLAQEYVDYADGYVQDNLYKDYANRQQEKAVGGGGGYGKLIASTALGWFIGGKIHSRRVTKKIKAKHMSEQKTLYTQYYSDVYKLQEQNAELQYVVEQLQSALKEVQEKAEQDALQRDYDEFKQPDIDGDDRISRAEFNMYVNNYLKNYPGLEEKDYPRFEDFDHDGDGYINFQEYAQQMALQVKQAEYDQYTAQQTGQGTKEATQKLNSLKGLYGETRKGDNFQDLYASLRR
mmetsp:Transcript_61178/g.72636  ORF Transcript_61178/g.72636 Transcript_61178/m.72636 type:complete len:248 (-) Transcript_61178:137-880(-)